MNPHERLDEHIKQLTGLTDARFEKAPEFAQVAKEILELIEDAAFGGPIMSNLMPIYWQKPSLWEGFELTTPQLIRLNCLKFSIRL